CRRANDALKVALRPLSELALRIERAEAVRARDYDALESLFVQLLYDLRRDRRKGSGAFSDTMPRERVVTLRDGLLLRLERFRRDAEADLAAALQEEMRGLVDGYEQLKQRSGKLDFSDLLIKVRDLVVGRREVREFLQNEFSHLFVDEFQDTDPLQLEILLLLAAADPAETDWRRARPAPGKLFLVGDPKQSIYRFRRADVDLYEEAKSNLRDGGVRLVELTRSFRAVRPIQEVVNAAFAPEMTGAPGYVPLHNHRDAPDGRPSVIVLPVPRPFGRSQVTKTAIDRSLPGATAAMVAWLIERSGWSIAARDVCILFRRFTNWGADVTRDYVRALEACGIPHLLVGARTFHRREEVETIRAALTAVEWPDDELSVFATLKGSLFAIPDETLLRFRFEHGAPHPYRKPPEDPEFAPLAEALALLRELHRERNRRAVVATVHHLLDSTRAHAGFALRPAGHQVLANLYRICDLARGYESGGGLSFRGFVEELAEQAEKEESIEAPVFEEGADGVRIMTVHAAKGLEFPVVVLADLSCHLSAREPDRYADPRGKLCATRLLGCSPHELAGHRDEEHARDEAEGLRVAYVAASRARDLLVIPAVGDEPLAEPVWLRPLDKAIYPPRESRRKPEPAPGCPAFGPSTVLEGPGGDPNTNFAIKPGLHGSVVWWDPAALDLRTRGTPGLRHEKLLAEDESGAASGESIRAYESWKSDRARALAAGRAPQFELLTATGAVESPPGEVEVRREEVARAGSRPGGRRFGALVHAILRD
ncbi:MAG: UvrD-helicase domain-containing protein, partial [Bryobacteraceae bacterium]